jgi:hypothetical protein
MTRSVMIARASASTPWRRRMNLGRRRMVGSCLPVHYFAYQRPSQRYSASLKTWKSDLSPKRSTTNIKRAPHECILVLVNRSGRSSVADDRLDMGYQPPGEDPSHWWLLQHADVLGWPKTSPG